MYAKRAETSPPWAGVGKHGQPDQQSHTRPHIGMTVKGGGVMGTHSDRRMPVACLREPSPYYMLSGEPYPVGFKRASAHFRCWSRRMSARLIGAYRRLLKAASQAE